MRAVTDRDRAGFSAFVEVGPAAPAILDVAKRFGADIVVIGRKATHDAQRIGSVALRVVRDSPVPVLVARDPVGNGPVVAAVDLGKGSTEVVRVAAEIARRRNTSLDVVHAIDFGRSEVLLALSAFFGGSMPPAADETGIVALALAALESELAANGAKGAASVVKGDPKHEVLARAATLGASLLVVGATAHPLLTRLGLGSVADAAVRGAATSVLVVRRSSEV
ncbi:MAG: universal stress protein [Polyangiaceae bacterium]|nr:universal stress protein [Polyangiaceae bacterium]